MAEEAPAASAEEEPSAKRARGEDERKADAETENGAVVASEAPDVEASRTECSEEAFVSGSLSKEEIEERLPASPGADHQDAEERIASAEAMDEASEQTAWPVPPPASEPSKDAEERIASAEAMDEASEQTAWPVPPPAPEPSKELERDSAPSSASKVVDPVDFHVADTTMNVLYSPIGRIVKPLTAGGMQHLLAGARANVGARAGRYLFEVKVIEVLTPAEDSHSRNRPRPATLLKVGFATAAASLLLADADCVGFDSEGEFFADQVRISIGVYFQRDSVYGVLLNLDETSPNFNTVSLFQDGVRVCDPQALPDVIRGKTLYPSLALKGMTVHVNFGPEALAPLPFRCRMLQDADQADVNFKAAPRKNEAKCEVLFPVLLPDEGTFDWLDLFLQANPHYTELSDRAILRWAEQSNVWKPNGYAFRSTNDRPDFGFGVRELDDFSVRKILQAVSSTQPRDIVVMEVRGNLLSSERAVALARYIDPMFKKVAVVAIGEPSRAFLERTHQLMLKQKQEASDAEFRRAQAAEQQKRAHEKRERELVRTRKAAERLLKEAMAAKAAQPKAEGEEDVRAENPEEGKEAEPEEKSDVEEVAPDPMDEDPPKVELSAEELSRKFRKSAIPDLSYVTLSSTFAKFTLPEANEGFDEVRFDWSQGPACQEYLRKWMVDKKLTTRMEDLKPGQWSQDEIARWRHCLDAWQQRQSAYKARLVANDAETRTKESMSKTAATVASAAPAGAEGATVASDLVAEAAPPAHEHRNGVEEAAIASAEATAAATGPANASEEAEKATEALEAEDVEDDAELQETFDSLDVFGVDDVCDVGGGVPLFKDFEAEDWALMALRFELHALVHAFRIDADDAERLGIHEDHVGFYYNKYFRKPLFPKYFGVEEIPQLLTLASDTVYLKKNKVLDSQLPQEIECLGVFVKLTEEARRYRRIRLDLGDASARIQIQRQDGRDGFARGEWVRRDEDRGFSKGGYGKAAGGKFGKGAFKGTEPYNSMPPYPRSDEPCSKGGGRCEWQPKGCGKAPVLPLAPQWGFDAKAGYGKGMDHKAGKGGFHHPKGGPRAGGWGGCKPGYGGKDTGKMCSGVPYQAWRGK